MYAHLPEENTEQLAQVHVVWSLFEAQTTAVVQIHGKLCWEALKVHIIQLSQLSSLVNTGCTRVLFRAFTLQRTSTGVDIFFSEIFSYFCFLVAAWQTMCKHGHVLFNSCFYALHLWATCFLPLISSSCCLIANLEMRLPLGFSQWKWRNCGSSRLKGWLQLSVLDQ